MTLPRDCTCPPGNLDCLHPTCPRYLPILQQRLTDVEDRVTRLSLQQHRHADHPDGYDSAYAQGFQDGYAHARREMHRAVDEMGKKPMPSGEAT